MTDGQPIAQHDNIMISWIAEHAQANMNSPTWAEHGQPSIDSRTSNCFALKKEQTPDKAAARSYIHTFIHTYIHTFNHSNLNQQISRWSISIDHWLSLAATALGLATVVGCLGLPKFNFALLTVAEHKHTVHKTNQMDNQTNQTDRQYISISVYHIIYIRLSVWKYKKGQMDSP